MQGTCPGYGPNNPGVYDRLTRTTDRQQQLPARSKSARTGRPIGPDLTGRSDPAIRDDRVGRAARRCPSRAGPDGMGWSLTHRYLLNRRSASAMRSISRPVTSVTPEVSRESGSNVGIIAGDCAKVVTLRDAFSSMTMTTFPTSRSATVPSSRRKPRSYPWCRNAECHNAVAQAFSGNPRSFPRSLQNATQR